MDWAPPEKLPDDCRGQLCGRHVAENAAETTDGCSQRLADHSFAHGWRACYKSHAGMWHGWRLRETLTR